MDLLTITDLELWTCIGLSEDERAKEQRVLVSVEVMLDTREAAIDDDVQKSIDYARVAADIQLLAGTKRKTIERLAEDIAKLVLENYRPQKVSVEVTKFALPGAREVRVRIERT